MATEGNGATVPPGTTYPPEFSMPPGATVPPGTTIPPSSLLQNGTATDILGDPNTAAGLDTGFGDMGLNANDINMDPVFLPAPIQEYEKVSATKNMAGVPRFGHTHEFAKVALLAYGDNKSDGEDYILGLLFVGCFLLVFFLVWTLTIIVFKIALQGFLSGEPFTNPHIDDPASLKAKEDAEEDGEEHVEDNSWLKRPRRIRITFFICGFIQILFAILLVTQGVSNLQQTTDTVQVSTDNMRLLINEAISVTENLKNTGDKGVILRDQIVYDLDKENFCPDNPAFTETQAGQSIVNSADAAINMMNQLGGFVGTNILILEESLYDAKRNLNEIDKTIEDMESQEWLGGLVAFPYLILTSLMMVGVVAAQLNTMTECFLCVLNWVVLPLFVFVTIMAYVGLGVMSIAASANADFCGGENSKPDQVLVDMMHYLGFSQTDLFFKTVRYYANQCTQVAETDPFLFLRNFDGAIVQGRVMVQSLTTSMDDISLEQLSLACNRDFRPLHRSLSQMVGFLDALLSASNRAINLLRCERVVPVYIDTVYDATCTYSVNGFTWLFSCLLIMSVMGMIMIMFRSSYQNTVFEKQPPPELMDESGSSVPFRRRNSKMPSARNSTTKKASERFSDRDEDASRNSSRNSSKNSSKQKGSEHFSDEDDGVDT